MLACLMIFLCAGMYSVNGWLPRLAAFWLPSGVQLQLQGKIHPGLRSLGLPDIILNAGHCEWVSLRGATVGYRQQMWQLSAQQLQLDSGCLENISSSPSASPPKSIADWQALLPAFRITIARFQILPWQDYSGSVMLMNRNGRQQLKVEGDKLQLDAETDKQQLNLRRLQVFVPGLPQAVSLQGTLSLAETTTWPLSGTLHGSVSVAEIPLQLAVQWQQQRGELSVTSVGQPRPLLHLPWEITPQSAEIRNGQWFWPFSTQPLQGGLSLTAAHWSGGLENTELTGRMNVLTSGKGGKGNAVLSVGPGKLSFHQSELPLRLTGTAGSPQLQFFASLPAVLGGPLVDPEIRFQRGALLRMRGKILDVWQVDEARFPLAGVRLAIGGVSGPLQAILKVHDQTYGQYRLQLSGQATKFWPDSGRWDWRYWGKGFLNPLQAHWDLQGKGTWQDDVITLNSLSTGLDRIKYANTITETPRLTLRQPLHWHRDPAAAQLNGGFLLTTGVTRFGYGGKLAPGKLPFTLRGTGPDNFQYQAQLTAGNAGPIISRGRWDGERLRGQLWWPAQPLQVFQTLAAPSLKLKFTGGTLRAQTAFSFSSEEGFQAGGHWVISNGSVWTPDNQVLGVDFSLPFRYHQQRWQFGYRQPVRLSIGSITNQFKIENITANLQGYYPWSEEKPLILSDTQLSVLDGQMRLSALRLPQHQPAILQADNISLSPLITALHPKQLAMSGRIDGRFPVMVDNPHYIIRNGWIKNNGPLTLRVDKDLIDSITSNNMAAGVAIDWLRYMEISRSEAELQLDSQGELTMKSTVSGTSRFSNKDQRVNLNYTHQENIFMLWRSLSFADNLQSLLSQQLKLPAEKEHNKRNLTSENR